MQQWLRLCKQGPEQGCGCFMSTQGRSMGMPLGHSESCMTYLGISGPQRPLQLNSCDGMHLVCLAQVVSTHLAQPNVLDLALLDKCLRQARTCLL